MSPTGEVEQVAFALKEVSGVLDDCRNAIFFPTAGRVGDLLTRAEAVLRMARGLDPVALERGDFQTPEVQDLLKAVTDASFHRDDVWALWIGAVGSFRNPGWDVEVAKTAKHLRTFVNQPEDSGRGKFMLDPHPSEVVESVSSFCTDLYNLLHGMAHVVRCRCSSITAGQPGSTYSLAVASCLIELADEIVRHAAAVGPTGRGGAAIWGPAGYKIPGGGAACMLWIELRRDGPWASFKLPGCGSFGPDGPSQSVAPKSLFSYRSELERTWDRACGKALLDRVPGRAVWELRARPPGVFACAQDARDLLKRHPFDWCDAAAERPLERLLEEIASLVRHPRLRWNYVADLTAMAKRLQGESRAADDKMDKKTGSEESPHEDSGVALCSSRENPWDESDKSFLPLSQAMEEYCTNPAKKISLPTLSRLCSRDGPFDYMRSPGKGCRVHREQFARWADEQGYTQEALHRALEISEAWKNSDEYKRQELRKQYAVDWKKEEKKDAL